MKVPYHNDTNNFVHVGPVTIAPGHTRDVDETHLHGFKAEKQAAAPVITDSLAELLKGTVKDVAALLPDMPTADIERLGELEQQGQGRKGILSAIGDLLLTRAANADMLARISALSDTELADQIASLGTGVDPEFVAALEAEAAKRNPGAAQ